MTARSGEMALKESAANSSSVRTGTDNFPDNRSEKAATERTGGGLVLKYAYTVSSKKQLFEMLLESLDSLLEYTDPENVVVFFTPPIENSDVEELEKRDVDVRKRQNFGDKITTTGFDQPSYYGNKHHITELEDDTVVFIDCDTVILNDPSEVIQGDFKVKALTARELDKEAWIELFKENNVETVFEKEINTGFVVFKDGFHREMKEDFGNFLKRDLHKDSFGGFNAHDQYAMSLVLGSQGIDFDSNKFKEMSKKEHNFQGNLECKPEDAPEDLVLYHKSDNFHPDKLGRIIGIIHRRVPFDLQNLARKIRKFYDKEMVS